MADSPSIDLEALAGKFIDTAKGVESPSDALKGAADIIAEEIAETADLRAWVRDYIFNYGRFQSSLKEEFEAGSTKYEMYREFTASAKDIIPHNMLALRRGEKEGIVVLGLEFDEEHVLSYLKSKIILTKQAKLIEYYSNTISDSFQRLMKHSLVAEVRLECKARADLASIVVFESNLRQLLLAAPAGQIGRAHV